MPKFMFLMFCVLSADVNIWVNGGWDQPKCLLAVYEVSPVGVVFEVISPSTSSKFYSIYAPIIMFQNLKTGLFKHNFILPVSVLKYQRNSNVLRPNNLIPKSG